MESSRGAYKKICVMPNENGNKNWQEKNLTEHEEEGGENVELEPLQRRTRFRVNRVDSLEGRASLLGEQETRKSLRNMTREALPRLDNYRNILSIQAAHRPSLDELHNPASTDKGADTTRLVTGGGGRCSQEKERSPRSSGVKFGWIQGVFVRCLLNIWGVMLFLRLSWVVAQAGVGETVLLIVTTTIVTTITSLSMSAISTNGLIKGGGTYYMISRSLGPEFGGSIGLIFSLANAVACSMYVVGFSESMVDCLKAQGGGLCIIDCDDTDIRIIGCITVVLLLGVVMIGMEWEAKAQFGLLVVLLVAILDFVIGSALGPKNDLERAKGFVGYNAALFEENFFSDYGYSEGVEHNFFSVLAIFFPAATGILAGANISGDLKDPQSAIPKGTLLAIFVTTISYLAMAFMVGGSVVRNASGNLTDLRSFVSSDGGGGGGGGNNGNGNGSVRSLNNNATTSLERLWSPYGTDFDCSAGCEYGTLNSFQVIELVSAFGPFIYAGCFAATLSSALASLVSAPKVFQALCRDRLYPGIDWFSGQDGKEPIRAYLLTFFIAFAFILIGQLNVIAPLISNFFLAAYTLVNFSTFHASLARPIGWRPTFKYYNTWLSLAGAIFCVAVMFLISWWTALITLSVVLALYLVVAYRKPDVNWGSTTQAQRYNNALTAVQQLDRVEEHVKNYRPQLLVLTSEPPSNNNAGSAAALVRFAHDVTKNQSLLICGHVIEKSLSYKTRASMLARTTAWFATLKIKAFYAIADGASFQDGAASLLQAVGLGKLRPNVLVMGYKRDWANCPRENLNMYFNAMHKALDMHVAVAILRLDSDQQANHRPPEQPLETNLGDADPRTSPPPPPPNGVSSQMRPNRSFSQLSQASSSSISDFSTPESPCLGMINEYPDGGSEQERTNPPAHRLDNFPLTTTTFPRKRTNGSIDVWWLYDDGGLTLLLPYIISTRRNWATSKLRVFALANKNSELEYEQRSMASLLSKFRIDYSALKVIADVSKPAKQTTREFFDSLIADFRSLRSSSDNGGGGGGGGGEATTITDSELLAMRDKTNRHLRLRELLIENSMEADLIVMTLPMPRKGAVSAPLYMAWLETLTRDAPPFFLVRGNHTSVLTFYS